MWPSSTARNETLGQREAVLGDIAGTRVPDPIALLVFDAVLDGLANRSQPGRLTDDEPMQGQCKDQRLRLRLSQHLLELIDDHLGKLPAGMIAMHLPAGVVQFHWIGNRQ